MLYVFDGDIANEVGPNAAVLFFNLAWWVKKNEENNNHYHDGCFWTYNSMKAFSNMFPYMTRNQIETALSKLKTNGYIKTGNYNGAGFDRTLWYSLTEKGEICHGNISNTFRKNPKPIPDINTDIVDIDKSISTYTPEKISSAFPPDSDAYKVASYLDRQILKRMPNKKPATEATLQRWAGDFDKLNRIDGYSWEDIKETLGWSQQDEFWKNNILSGQTFRKQFVKLFLTMTSKEDGR